MALSQYDLNNDGEVTDVEIARSEKLIDIELREEKSDAQRKMAWTSMISLLIVSGLVLSPIIGNERVAALGDVLPLFYIAQAGIVGAYFGATAMMHTTKK